MRVISNSNRNRFYTSCLLLPATPPAPAAPLSDDGGAVSFWVIEMDIIGTGLAAFVFGVAATLIVLKMMDRW